MKKLKLYWETKYVKEGQITPDDQNRWLMHGRLKIDCSEFEKEEWNKTRFATVAVITQRGTANATFVNHSYIPQFNIRIDDILSKSNMFNTGTTSISQFYDTVEECQKFAESAINFHFDMLQRAETY